METIAAEFPELVSGLGHVTSVDPIQIEIDDSIRPLQQKRRTILLKYVYRLESLLNELSVRGVVSGPLDHKSAMDGYITL